MTTMIARTLYTVAMIASSFSMMTYSYENDNLSYTECLNDTDCQSKYNWEAPYQECVSGLCKCPLGTCQITTQLSFWNSQLVRYYCGTCGSYGSQCSSDESCLPPDSLCDIYCRCPNDHGYVSYGFCHVFVPTSAVSSLNLVLTGVLILIIILNKFMNS
ncbi:uncharacterized protein LOC108681286, partial [Hyalella azteca]|uniref:Uncharacterized protein LOC108681286 n=1 Tax=Hyalella azteca TaxID=294128 RepID=A0A8B7PIH5_HYAAZ